jgi:hypothetical protein
MQPVQLRGPLRNIDIRHAMLNEPIMKTSRLLTAVAVLEGVYDVDRTACPIDLDGLADVRAWIECGGIRLT